MESAIVLLTSDHGESFGERWVLYHDNNVYEEEVHVPLIIGGGKIGSGSSSSAASLVDIPTTLAHLAGIDTDDSWVGRSLFDESASEPCAFSFKRQAHSKGKTTSIFALYEGARKLQGKLEDGTFLLAFDLAEDPNELDNLAESGVSWPGEIYARWDESLREAVRLGTPPKSIVLSETELEGLRAMGYFGD